MQTKPTLYGSKDYSADNRPGISRSMGLSAPFTQQENDLFKALSAAICPDPYKTSWTPGIALCIKEVRQTGNLQRFRELVRELKEQARDGREAMENIIGKEALKILFEISAP